MVFNWRRGFAFHSDEAPRVSGKKKKEKNRKSGFLHIGACTWADRVKTGFHSWVSLAAKGIYHPLHGFPFPIEQELFFFFCEHKGACFLTSQLVWASAPWRQLDSMLAGMGMNHNQTNTPTTQRYHPPSPVRSCSKYGSCVPTEVIPPNPLPPRDELRKNGTGYCDRPLSHLPWTLVRNGIHWLGAGEERRERFMIWEGHKALSLWECEPLTGTFS